ncbi:hypothetical protein [Kineococcus terrestris]|uniref:hypothetical protein n=1 Tax=Kineococcus terrestris TaxID=2044856 RepID=UPI0034DB0B66
MSARPLVFLDTETTSLLPDRQAWEVAIIRRDLDGRRTTWEAMLPVDITSADPASLRIGGYYDRHPVGRWLTGKGEPQTRTVQPHQAARRIVELTHEATIVGACPWFDTETLERFLRRYDAIPSWHYRLRDVEAMTAGFAGSAEVGGLAHCAQLLDVVQHDPHTAMGDALTAERIWDALVLASHAQEAS